MSPTWILSTASPPPITSPTFSWPKTRPSLKSVRPSYMCRSEPQMLVAVIRTSASVGFSILASGTSSTLTLRGPWYTTAFTRISFGSAELRVAATVASRRLARYPAAGELLDDRRAEGGQVRRGAAGGELAVDDDLLVDRLRAGIAQVIPQAGPRGEPAAVDDAPRGKGPRAVADRRDGLACLGEGPDERHRVWVDPQLVGVDGASRQQQGVVVIRGGIGDELVDRERARRYQVELPGLDLAGVDRQQLGVGARAVQRPARLLEFDPLDAVSGQDRDTLAAEVTSHAFSFNPSDFLGSPSGTPPSGARRRQADSRHRRRPDSRTAFARCCAAPGSPHASAAAGRPHPQIRWYRRRPVRPRSEPAGSWSDRQ